MTTILNLFPAASTQRKFFTDEQWLTLKEEILALTLFGGNFPCNIVLLETVALSIMTRVHLANDSVFYQTLFGDDVVAVCLKKNQYRAWQEFGRVMINFYRISQQKKEFEICQRIARRAVKNVITLSPRIKFFVDDGPGARCNPTHFHHMEEHPDWAVGLDPLFFLNSYCFYRIL